MRLSRLFPVNPPIREALPLDLVQGLGSAFIIGDTGSGAIGEAEIEFVDIALQVRFRNRVIGSVEAALEKPEISFDGIAMDSARARVLADGVIDSFVSAEFLAEAHALVVHRAICI